MKNIHISNDGQSSSLRVNWTPGQGDVDQYNVSLSQMGGRPEERSIPKHVNEMSFQGLLPGQQYTITITSISGFLINNSTETGRTGEITIYGVFPLVSFIELLLLLFYKSNYRAYQHHSKISLKWFID